jgi:glycosyltransferase involved in cell wall biosynthesis
MSLVLLEAMAVGATVVATDCGDSREALGAAGVVLYHADDEQVVAHLQTAVQRLLASGIERDELGRRAQARVEERFLLKDTVAHYLALWHEV